jgi:hypothetical protein
MADACCLGAFVGPLPAADLAGGPGHSLGVRLGGAGSRPPNRGRTTLAILARPSKASDADDYRRGRVRGRHACRGRNCGVDDAARVGASASDHRTRLHALLPRGRSDREVALRRCARIAMDRPSVSHLKPIDECLDRCQLRHGKADAVAITHDCRTQFQECRHSVTHDFYPPRTRCRRNIIDNCLQSR